MCWWYLSELSVLKDCAQACCSLLPPFVLGHFLFSHQLRSPFSSRCGEGWVPTGGHLMAEALCRDGLGSPWSCRLWREGLAQQLSSRFIFPIPTHVVCYLNGPVQWTDTCPNTSGGICPTLSTGGPGRRVEELCDLSHSSACTVINIFWAGSASSSRWFWLPEHLSQMRWRPSLPPGISEQVFGYGSLERLYHLERAIVGEAFIFSWGCCCPGHLVI